MIPTLFDEQASSINLPSSVFASEFEEEVGLLNKAAPISGKQLISSEVQCCRFRLCWQNMAEIKHNMDNYVLISIKSPENTGFVTFLK